MTDEQALISQIHKLPESLKEEVARFVAKLTGESGASNIGGTNGLRSPRKAGSAAGKYHMAPDFDEPLEDFNAYDAET